MNDSDSFQLLTTLEGKALIRNIAWAPDGVLLAAACSDKHVRIWNPDSKTKGLTAPKILGAPHTGSVVCVAWSPDGQTLASGSKDKTIVLWTVSNWKKLGQLQGHAGDVNALAWSPDGSLLASASDDGTVRLWRGLPFPEPSCEVLLEHGGTLRGLAWSPDGKWLAAASQDKSVRIWDAHSRQLHRELLEHAGPVRPLAWSPDSRWLASGSDDKTLHLWEAETGRSRVREGHTGAVSSLSFSHDSQLLASWATDGTVRLWSCENLEELASLSAVKSLAWIPGLAFHPQERQLALAEEKEARILIFSIAAERLPGLTQAAAPVAYTTAKIVLVGEGRVGKTSLWCRLVRGTFEEHPPTHGQHSWVVPKLGVQRSDGAQCEPVLWDLAGQPEYRLVHALYLGDVDLGLIVFDPRQEQLKGVEYWLSQLSRTRERREPSRTILVGAAVDRGDLALGEEELQDFAQAHGATGGYVGTSAKTGEGIDELVENIRSEVPWDRLEARITTETFGKVKSYVLDLKKQEVLSEILLDPADLRARLEAQHPGWQFTDEDLMTAVGHAQNHGFVAILRRPDGGRSVLLAPDLLANAASSLVQFARQHPLGLGTLDEDRVLCGGYEIPELAGLKPRDREVLLAGVVVRFLDNAVCFRESSGGKSLLVFPSLITQKRPSAEGRALIEGPSYRVRGAVENVYASLVVRLGSNNLFERAQAWEKQAEFETEQGGICGFRQESEREGEVELVLYHGRDLEREPLLFQALFEQFLSGRGLTVTRLDRGAAEAKDPLSSEEQDRVTTARKTARAQEVYQQALVMITPRIDPARRNPACFLSYARDDGGQLFSRLRDFALALRQAGLKVRWDRWAEAGQPIDGFIEKSIEESEFALVAGSPLYLRKYKEQNHYVYLEVQLLSGRQVDKQIVVVPLLFDGDIKTSIPMLLGNQNCLDFRNPKAFFGNLFYLLLTLYGLPLDDPAIDDLRWEIERVEKEGEETLEASAALNPVVAGAATAAAPA